ncbi:MAG: ferritin family protein [archaeon]
MLFRCRICGDPYIGETKPSRCPFCGAYENFIVDAKDYRETFDVELSEADRANAEKALEVELSNSSFYFCAAEKSDDEVARQMFKALGKVEAEHAAIWKKILKLGKTMPKPEGCSGSARDNMGESHERETRAIAFYGKALSESGHPRVRQIFAALVQVETDHLRLSENYG